MNNQTGVFTSKDGDTFEFVGAFRPGLAKRLCRIKNLPVFLRHPAHAQARAEMGVELREIWNERYIHMILRDTTKPWRGLIVPPCAWV